MTNTLPIWPTQLPAISQNQYQWSHAEGFLRTEMESGPAKQRRLFRYQPQLQDVLWHMQADALEIFEAFYHHTLKSGSLWFSLPLWNGSGYTPHTVRFLAPYQVRLIRAQWVEVLAKLEIKNPKRLSVAELHQKTTEKP